MRSPVPLPEVDGYPSWLTVGKTFLKCQRVLAGLLRELDLTIAQHEVLVAVYRQGGSTQGELAERLLVVKSNVSALIRKLEDRGLVDRGTDAADARRRVLHLTPAGRRLVRRSFALQNRVVEAMMSTLEPGELDVLDSIMDRVSGALDDLQAEDDRSRR
ncbi:MAG: MarR family transcriptional regulator [Acidobacteriota bacterium]